MKVNEIVLITFCFVLGFFAGGKIFASSHVQHELTWTNSPGTTSVDVQVQVDDQSTWWPVASGVTGESYIHANVPYPEFSTFKYRLKAYDATATACSAGSEWSALLTMVYFEP